MNSLIECPICNSKLECPIILPCSHTICRKHEDKEMKKITCPICSEDHMISEKSSFPLNALAQALLDCKLEKLDLGVEHRVAVESFEDLKQLVDEFKQMREHPDVKINESIGELRNRIDLRREMCKKKIDDEAHQLIDELDAYEAKCQAALVTRKRDVSHETDEMIKQLEKEMASWEKEIVTFEKNAHRWLGIHCETISKYQKLRQERDRMKLDLLGDEFTQLRYKQQKFCNEDIEPLICIKLEMNNHPYSPTKSEIVHKYGIKWILAAEYLECDGSDLQRYLNIYLCAKNEKKEEEFKIKAEVMVLNKICPEKSITKDISNANDFYPNVWSFSEFVKISELKANRAFYDHDAGSFTIQANIYDLKWTK